MKRILFLYRDSPYARFIRDEVSILRERYLVDEIRLEAEPRALSRVLLAGLAADLVYFWWGDLTGLAGAVLSRLRGKPCVMVTGGYDIADVPEIRYGLRHHRYRKHLPPLVLGMATEIIANARCSQDAVVRDYGIDPAKVRYVPHGLDPARIAPGAAPRERRVLTCSLISREYVPYKGLDTFVHTARLLPEVPFVHVGGSHQDGALERLRSIAPPNVTFRGFLEERELVEEMQRTAVYAQLSAHEGFGIALAESMLAGATPVVTRAGAIPEVVGSVGEYVDYGDAPGTARAIARAFASPRSDAARQRIVTEFPLSRRRDGVFAAVEKALGVR